MPADLSTARCPSCGAPLPLVAAYAVKCGNCGTVSETPEADRRSAGGQIEGFEFRISAEEATKRAAAYLGQGALTPGDVATAARATLRPQALLVPVWVYKMTVGCAWSAEIGDQQITQERAEVKNTTGKPTQTTSSKVTVSWSARQGTTSESFDGQAVAAAAGEWAPVATTLARAHHEDAKPLSAALAAATVVEASAASTAARESVYKPVSSTAVAHCTAQVPGTIKRNVAVTPTMTAVERKTVYVPVWVTTYNYQGKDRTVIVDGLAGAVTGSRPVSTKRVGVVAAVGGTALVLFMCCGMLNSASHRSAGRNDGGGPTSPATVAPPPEAAAPEQADVAAAATAEAAPAPVEAAEPPQPPSPWDDPAMVKLGDNKRDFNDRFWPMFDDLYAPREEAAIEKLKEAQPATWQSGVAAAKKQAAAERAEARKALLATTFTYAVPGALFLPSYDAKAGGFKAAVDGVKPVDVGLFGGTSGWTLAFEKAPQSTRELVSDVPAKNGGTLKTYKYGFTGGKPISIFLPVAPPNADSFYKANQGSLDVEVMFRVKSAVQDKPHLEHGGSALSPEAQSSAWGEVTAGVLRDATTDAGKALVVGVTAWRVETREEAVIASWGP